MKKLILILIVAFAGIMSASAQQCNVAGTTGTVEFSTYNITGDSRAEIVVVNDTPETVNVRVVLRCKGEDTNGNSQLQTKTITIIAQPKSSSSATVNCRFTNGKVLKEIDCTGISGRKCS